MVTFLLMSCKYIFIYLYIIYIWHPKGEKEKTTSKNMKYFFTATEVRDCTVRFKEIILIQLLKGKYTVIYLTFR